ncbi:hypothetical protein [Dactylosporangium sp. NPDC049140]|uniref:hypothetical protein n=1 Tax=Dactylosporangium sp. NPDC049140 TaxID=3155647 RepID=UPI0033F5BEFB
MLTEAADGSVRALSKGLGVRRDGTVGSVTYEDTLAQVDAGWRITHRVVRR